MLRADQVWARLPDGLRRLAHHLVIRPGHYYSPYPDLGELRRRAGVVFTPPEEYPGIDLHLDEQRALLDRMARHHDDLPWRAGPVPGLRYQYENRPYAWGDGVHLACLLAELRPRRYLEVGSGWSTALALDVRERLLGGEGEMACIDPYPERLAAAVGDPAGIEVIRQPVQDVALDRFGELEAGDILVIDTSHTLKPGGDVNHLFFEVLPRLSPGVVVHLHDVFAGFEYPREWVFSGRAWTEAYLVRALLTDSDRWRILLWTAETQRRWPGWYAEHMPTCATNPGATLYLVAGSVPALSP